MLGSMDLNLILRQDGFDWTQKHLDYLTLEIPYLIVGSTSRVLVKYYSHTYYSIIYVKEPIKSIKHWYIVILGQSLSNEVTSKNNTTQLLSLPNVKLQRPLFRQSSIASSVTTLSKYRLLSVIDSDPNRLSVME